MKPEQDPPVRSFAPAKPRQRDETDEQRLREALQQNEKLTVELGRIRELLRQANRRKAHDSALPAIDLAKQRELTHALNKIHVSDHYYFVDVVGSCNLKCPSCAVGNMAQLMPKGVMTVTKFKETLAKIRSDQPHGARLAVDLYNWGEPGLHRNLSELVRLAKERQFVVGISSNLNVFPDLKNVVRESPDYFRISLSGSRNQTYGMTHRLGNINAVKANMYRLREFMDRYESEMIVQVGFHVYRSNFPDDFLAIRSLCDELGFLFAPVLATIMPVEKVIDVLDGTPGAVEEDLLDNLVIGVDETLSLYAQAAGPTSDCQFRERRTTINFDGSVSLCCATYGPDSVIADDFLHTTNEEILTQKYAHGQCKTCMGRHINKIFTGFEPGIQNAAAIRVLGPVFEAYLEEQAAIVSPDWFEFDGTVQHRDDVYRLGLAALSKGDAGIAEATNAFEALVKFTPSFGEGHFQLARLMHRSGHVERSRILIETAKNMCPDNPNYVAEYQRIFEASASDLMPTESRR